MKKHHIHYIIAALQVLMQHNAAASWITTKVWQINMQTQVWQISVPVLPRHRVTRGDPSCHCRNVCSSVAPLQISLFNNFMNTESLVTLQCPAGSNAPWTDLVENKWQERSLSVLKKKKNSTKLYSSGYDPEPQQTRLVSGSSMPATLLLSI